MPATTTHPIADALGISPVAHSWTLPGFWNNNGRMEQGEYLVVYEPTPERLAVQRFLSTDRTVTGPAGFRPTGRMLVRTVPNAALRMLQRRGIVLPHDPRRI